MNNPLVSVIVPAYNNACFIRETIDSVLNQTYQNWELFVIDDGSKDDTLSIALSYASRNPKIKALSLGKNSGGPATPRNYGMRQAQGKYIAFLDADDLWLPQKLEKQVYFMEKHPDVFWLHAKYELHKDGKFVVGGPKNPKSGNILKDLLLHFNIVPILTVMIRNNKDKNVYFFDEDRRLSAVEDYGMWLSIARNEPIAFLDELVAIYRMNSNGISANGFLTFMKCGLILRKFRPHISKSEYRASYRAYALKLIRFGIWDAALYAREIYRTLCPRINRAKPR